MSHRRAGRAVVLGTLSALGVGCSWYRTHFPARDEVFKPIPIDIGERRVRGADTTYAVGGDGYELIVPDRELLPDAKRTLDYAAREFVRTFGVLPPPVVVEARWMDGDARPARRTLVDSTYRRPDGRRAIAVRVAPPPKDARQRELAMRYYAPLAAAVPAVSRAWLSGYADGAPPRAGSSPTAPRAEGPAWTLVDDPRLPDWLEEGVVALVAPSPRQDLLDAAVAREVDALPALRSLFVAARPGAPRRDGRPDPVAYSTEGRADRPRDRPIDAPEDGDPRVGRARARRQIDRRARLGEAERFAAQSASVVQFLARREGRAFVGRLVDRVLDGATVEAALAEARSLPASLDALDRTWRVWVAQREDVRMPGLEARP